LGLCPKPRKLFEKSLNKNFKFGLAIYSVAIKKSAYADFLVKVLMKLFQKFPGFGAEPQGLLFSLHSVLLFVYVHNYSLYVFVGDANESYAVLP